MPKLIEFSNNGNYCLGNAFNHFKTGKPNGAINIPHRVILPIKIVEKHNYPWLDLSTVYVLCIRNICSKTLSKIKLIPGLLISGIMGCALIKLLLNKSENAGN